MGERLDRGEPHATAAAVAFEPHLELCGLEIVWVSADPGILRIVEVVLEDEGLDLVRKRLVVFLGPPDRRVTPIRKLGDLVVDDSAVGGGVAGVRGWNRRLSLGEQRLVGREPERRRQQAGDLTQAQTLAPLPDDTGRGGRGREAARLGRSLGPGVRRRDERERREQHNCRWLLTADNRRARRDR